MQKKIAGINYPPNGSALYQESLNYEQGSIGVAITDRFLDQWTSGVFDSGELSVVGSGIVRLNTLLAFDGLGRRIRVANPVDISVPSGTSTIIARHTFHETPGHVPDAFGTIVQHRTETAEILCVQDVATDSIPLYVAVNSGGAVELTDIRVFCRPKNRAADFIMPGMVMAAIHPSWIPPSGEVLNGWMRADGSIVPPGYRLSGWQTPDLSNRFIQGNAAPGGSGGSNKKILQIDEIPSHKHQVSVSVSPVEAHTHTATGGTTGDAGAHEHKVAIRVSFSDYSGTWENVGKNSESTSDGHFVKQSDGESENVRNTVSSSEPGHSHSLSGIAIGQGGDHNHATAVTESSIGGGSEYDTRPAFFDAVYLVKVD